MRSGRVAVVADGARRSGRRVAVTLVVVVVVQRGGRQQCLRRVPRGRRRRVAHVSGERRRGLSAGLVRGRRRAWRLRQLDAAALDGRVVANRAERGGLAA